MGVIFILWKDCLLKKVGNVPPIFDYLELFVGGGRFVFTLCADAEVSHYPHIAHELVLLLYSVGSTPHILESAIDMEASRINSSTHTLTINSNTYPDNGNLFSPLLWRLLRKYALWVGRPFLKAAFTRHVFSFHGSFLFSLVDTMWDFCSPVSAWLVSLWYFFISYTYYSVFLKCEAFTANPFVSTEEVQELLAELVGNILDDNIVLPKQVRRICRAIFTSVNRRLPNNHGMAIG